MVAFAEVLGALCQRVDNPGSERHSAIGFAFAYTEYAVYSWHPAEYLAPVTFWS